MNNHDYRCQIIHTHVVLSPTFVVLTGLRYSRTLACTTETTACTVPFAHRFATAYMRLFRMQEYVVPFAHRFATTYPFVPYAGVRSSFCTQVCYHVSVCAVCRSTKFVLHTGLLPRISVCTVCRSTKFVLHCLGLLLHLCLCCCIQEHKVRFAKRLLPHIRFRCCTQEEKVRFAHRFATAHPFLLLYAGVQSSFCTHVCYAHQFLLHAGAVSYTHLTLPTNHRV